MLSDIAYLFNHTLFVLFIRITLLHFRFHLSLLLLTFNAFIHPWLFNVWVWAFLMKSNIYSTSNISNSKLTWNSYLLHWNFNIGYTKKFPGDEIWPWNSYFWYFKNRMEIDFKMIDLKSSIKVLLQNTLNWTTIWTTFWSIFSNCCYLTMIYCRIYGC